MPPNEEIKSRFRAAAGVHRLFSRPGYTAYLLARLRSLPLRGTVTRIMEILRPWRLLTLILRIIARLITWLETGTLLLLLLLAGTLALPPLLLCGLLTPITWAVQNRRCATRLQAIMDQSPGGQIYVCFAAPRALEPNSYFRGMIRALTARGGTVLVVPHSPRRGSSPLRTGSAMHREEQNLYFIRERLYFHLRRRVLLPRRARLTLIY
ncbi:MAG: hypothetical protein E7654_04850 [Ruminococcaceae bacterium]|nr:hypothetical protein [Oscillospiraceae bacterium]